MEVCRPSCDDADLEQITDGDLQTKQLRCRSCGQTRSEVSSDVAKVLADAGLDANGYLPMVATELLEEEDAELAEVIDIDQARRQRRSSKTRRSATGSWGTAFKMLLVGCLIILVVMAIFALIE